MRNYERQFAVRDGGISIFSAANNCADAINRLSSLFSELLLTRVNFVGPRRSFSPVIREISLAVRNFARLFRNKFAREFIHSLFGRMKATMYASPIKCRRFRDIRAPQRPNSVDSLGRDSLCLFFFSFTAGSNRRGYPQSAEIIKTARRTRGRIRGGMVGNGY